MMKNLKLIFLSLAAGLFGIQAVCAQELIQFMNGQTEFATVVDTAGGVLKVKEFDSGKKKKKSKDHVVSLNRQDVFSVKYASGEEVIYYVQDTLTDDDEHILTVNEMRSYLAGSHDAAARFASSGATWVSFVAGLASGVFMPAILSPVVPGLVVATLGTRWIRVDRSHVSNPKFLGDDFYLMGYERTARARRINGSIGGALAGLGLGLGLSFTVFNEE
jgi:hypothetical protein